MRNSRKIIVIKPLISILLVIFNLTNLSYVKSNIIDEANSKINSKKSKILQSDSYILGNGDQLSLKIIDAPELSSELRVLNDGSIQIPIVGNYNIKGKTIDQASKEIKILLSDHLLRPDLYLTITNPRPIKVALIGEVQSPGLYSMSLTQKNSGVMGVEVTSSDGMPTLVDAIQQAGGITNNADLNNIFIDRLLPGNNNKYKRANINLSKLILNGDQSYNPFLFDGDKIIVKKAIKESFNSLEIIQANLSPKKIQINVVGEVKNPGNVSVNSGTSLAQAILSAGGPINWRANKGNVRLIRVNRDGTLINKKYRLNLRQPPSVKNNPIVANGDNIFVGINKLGSTSDGLQAISKPASSIVTVWSLLKLIGD